MQTIPLCLHFQCWPPIHGQCVWCPPVQSFTLMELLMTTFSFSCRIREGQLTGYVTEKTHSGIQLFPTVFQLIRLGSGTFPSPSELPGAPSPCVFFRILWLLLPSLHQVCKFPRRSNLCELLLARDSSAFLSAPLLCSCLLRAFGRWAYVFNLLHLI